jgi:hypothetical protein
MSSSVGSRSLGVVVVVMLSFVGSMSWILVPTEASAWMLYALRVRHRSDALSGATAERGAQWASEDSNWSDRCWSIVGYYAGKDREDDGASARWWSGA